MITIPSRCHDDTRPATAGHPHSQAIPVVAPPTTAATSVRSVDVLSRLAGPLSPVVVRRAPKAAGSSAELPGEYQ